jgi:hypothetical protein
MRIGSTVRMFTAEPVVTPVPAPEEPAAEDTPERPTGDDPGEPIRAPQPAAR